MYIKFDKTPQISAFTLVELSIVLVIIGLLTAGVVGGQSLIESSKQRNVVSKLTGISTGVRAFQLEYDAIPGDFNNAFAYFGANCTTSDNSGTPTTTTCNGDGDGIVSGMKEATGFWKHMELAGIMQGGNTVMTATPAALVGGTTAAKTPYDGIVMTARNYGTSNCLDKLNSNLIEIGKAGTGVNVGLANDETGLSGNNGVKTIKGIDSKIDDGKGCSGNFTGTGAGVCPFWNAAMKTDYALAAGSGGCIAVYKYQN